MLVPSSSSLVSRRAALLGATDDPPIVFDAARLLFLALLLERLLFVLAPVVRYEAMERYSGEARSIVTRGRMTGRQAQIMAMSGSRVIHNCGLYRLTEPRPRGRGDLLAADHPVNIILGMAAGVRGQP